VVGGGANGANTTRVATQREEINTVEEYWRSKKEKIEDGRYHDHGHPPHPQRSI
jgi:hypothetical protein